MPYVREFASVQCRIIKDSQVVLVTVTQTVSSHENNATYQKSSLPPTPPVLPVFSASPAHPLMGEVAGNLLRCFS